MPIEEAFEVGPFDQARREAARRWGVSMEEVEVTADGVLPYVYDPGPEQLELFECYAFR